MADEKKPISNRVISGGAGALGGGGNALGVVALWNWLMPDNPMPPEVAAFVASLFAAMFGMISGWAVRDN